MADELVTRTSATEVLGDAEPRAGEADADRLTTGTRIGRYIVLDPVGEGGMGAVYAAYDPGLDRKVALKLLLRRERGDDHREFLLGEAKTLAKLRHPHVLGVHDVGATGEGRLFMATDLIDGADARAWTRAAARTWRDVRQVFVDAGRGLAAAHGAGLIHRDFKPSNVLVDRAGRACVADFGIAIGTSGSVESSVAAGTRPYMAPELLRGEPATPASDQYAFGVALHELLLGHRPGEEPRPGAAGVARVPGFLRAAIARTLAEDPAARFADMNAVVRALSADPGRRVRVAIVAAAAVAAIAVPLVVIARAPDAPPPCLDTPEVLAGAWDEPRRAAVRAALAPHASAGDVDATLAALDGYARAWRATHLDACVAARVHHTQSQEVMALRLDCLDQRRGELRALADALARAAELGATDPAGAAGRLPSVAVCDEVTLLRSRAPLPDSLEQQARSQAFDDDLAALRASISLTQLPGAALHERAQQLVARARQLGVPRHLAEALEQRGTTEGGATALATFQEAMVAAQAARDYEVLLLAGANAVTFLCNVSRYGEARFLAHLARASYEAGGRPRSLERLLLTLEGRLGLCESKPDVAITAFSRLYELDRGDASPSARLGNAGNATNVAFAYHFLERPEEAIAWSARARALMHGLVESPNMVINHFADAWAAVQLGAHAYAERPLERAAAALRELGDRVGELDCYLPMTNGLVALARDRRADARVLQDEAAACFEQHDAARSIAAALNDRARAELALAEGDGARGLAHARAAAASLALDQADRRNAITHATIARALLRHGHVDEAAAELARAEPFLAEDDHPDERWAMVAWARAELLLARGDAAAATVAAGLARALRARRHDAFHVAELDALLARARREARR